MAPEVAAGEPATRAADVYGLGAMLYTLLVGRSPYAGATVADVLTKVRTTDPAPFSAAKVPVPPALVAVCRRAMARSPGARYRNAEEVAADVRRWLADEPVSVYREPWAARAARWARGRKTAVVAAAVLLLTTAIAATVTAGLVWREQRQTKVQWERAEGETAKATENADTAITVVRDLSTYIRLVELSGSRQAVTDRQRRLALDRALPGYERLLALHPGDEQLMATIAVTHRFRANLCRVLGEAGESEESFRAARRLYGELVSAGNPTYQFDLALTSRDFALLLRTVGRLNEAAEILDGSIPQFEARPPDGPDRSRQERMLASMLLDRAELDYPLGRFAEAERHARRAADLYARLADRGADPSEPLDPLFRGMAEIRLAIALRALGRVDDALAVHDRVIERFAGILKAPTGAAREYVLEYHRAQAERAWTLAQLPGRRASGLADLDGAIAGFERLAKQYPQFPAYPRSQGMGTLFRGRLKALLGQPEAAVQDLNAAARIFEGLVGKYPDVPGYRSYLGQTYTALGRLDRDPVAAAGWYRKAHEMLAGAVRRSPENVLDRQLLTELDALREAPETGPK
jgi:tetratricopeptide (TPR) repeat protein